MGQTKDDVAGEKNEAVTESQGMKLVVESRNGTGLEGRCGRRGNSV